MPLPEFKQIVDEAKAQITEIGADDLKQHATVGRGFYPD